MANRLKLNLAAIFSAMWGKRVSLRFLRVLAASALALVVVGTLPAFAHSKKAKDLKWKNGNDRVEVIVQFSQSPNQKHLDKIKKHGGYFKKNFKVIKAGLVTVPASAIDALAQDPEVTYVSPNRVVKAAHDYYNATVGANIAKYNFGFDGAGVGVAVIDSGLKPHADLQVPGAPVSRVVYSQNFTAAPDANDGYGHGIHVAGIIAGNGSESAGAGELAYRGIAPSSRIINLRVLDKDGRGSDASVIAAIQRAIELKDAYNIRVINLSLGRPVRESYTVDPLCQAVEAAWRAGIVVVVAAGNLGRDTSLGTNGYGTIASPGNNPFVITVGATNTHATENRADDNVTTFSSKGPTLLDHVVKPDLVAPGNGIVSLYAGHTTLGDNYPANRVVVGDKVKYFRLSGTSMAAPVVSGAAALLLQQNPSLNPDQVKARLMKTAWKSFPAYSDVTVNGVTTTLQNDIFTVGAGYLDIAAALESADLAEGTAMSPQVVRDELGNFLLVSDPSAVWGGSVMWGSSVLWGSSVVWGTNVVVSGTSVIWGSSVLWGNTTVDGYSVIWGSSVIWGASADEAAASSIDAEGDGEIPTPTAE